VQLTSTQSHPFKILPKKQRRSQGPVKPLVHLSPASSAPLSCPSQCSADWVLS